MGPLAGTTILEFAAIGPAPFGVMLLADLGADIIRIDRVAAAKGSPGFEATMRGLSRGRRSIGLDLKSEEGLDVALRLAASADVLVEGWRPGVAERLGVGPDACLARNPGLVYARVTGWGQDGPLAQAAGHDIDYAAVAGALYPIGRAGSPPPPPLNFLSDFAGGGCYLVIGILAALVHRDRTGVGQVVDAAMIDGTASLTAFFHGLRQMGAWRDEREANLLDGAAPYYDSYACADGRYLAVGAIEPQFYAALLAGLGLDPTDHPQGDPARWPEQKQVFAEVISSKTQAEWVATFEGTDACVAPILPLHEAPDHPHNVARGVFVEVGGAVQPAPAPRLSATPLEVPGPVPDYGQHTDEVLGELGYDADTITALRAADVVA